MTNFGSRWIRLVKLSGVRGRVITHFIPDS